MHENNNRNWVKIFNSICSYSYPPGPTSIYHCILACESRRPIHPLLGTFAKWPFLSTPCSCRCWDSSPVYSYVIDGREHVEMCGLCVRPRYWPDFEFFDFRLFFPRCALDDIHSAVRLVENNICHFNGLFAWPNGRENDVIKLEEILVSSWGGWWSCLQPKIGHTVRSSALTHIKYSIVPMGCLLGRKPRFCTKRFFISHLATPSPTGQMCNPKWLPPLHISVHPSLCLVRFFPKCDKNCYFYPIEGSLVQSSTSPCSQFHSLYQNSSLLQHLYQNHSPFAPISSHDHFFCHFPPSIRKSSPN